MHKILGACFVAVLLSGSGINIEAQADTITSTTHTIGPGAAGVVLDSYMKPTVVRSREVMKLNGETERVVEPIIQERHETVAIPIEETVSTTATRAGKTVVKTTSSDSTKTVRRASSKVRKVARKPSRRRVASRNVKRKRYVAQRTYVEPASTTVVESRSVQKNVIIEGKDPALLVY